MSSLIRILLIEDDVYFRADIASKLKKYGMVRGAGNFEDACDLLRAEKFDVAMIDLGLRGKNSGLELVALAAERGVTPIVLTGNVDPKMIARAYEVGCKHYFSKLDIQDQLDRELGFYLKQLGNRELDEFIAREFITQDPFLVGLIDQLRHQNLNRDQKVLLLGPTGVGKTKIAKLIHRLSEPNYDRFIHQNLAEVPDSLAESLLFGHKKGAFTGATEDRDGLFKKADGGTLFLDEVASISLNLQKKLLKVLEEREFVPLGGTTPIKTEFRLIAATCEDILKLIETKKFRLDLYFRLKGLELSIPSLKQRKGDVPKLVEHFAAQSARKVSFSKSALDCLATYDWHGNVRELEQLVKSLSGGSRGLIKKEDLPVHIQNNENPYDLEAESAADKKIYSKSVSQYIQKHGLRKFIDCIEKEAFEEAFKRNAGNLTRTQRELRVSKSAVYRIFEDVQAQRKGAGNEDFSGFAP